MKKLVAYAIAVILLPISYADMQKAWNPRYDGYHNCVREWWNIDAFIRADKNYSITASFEYEKETPAANLFFTIFDWDEKKVYDLGSYEDNISIMKCKGKYSVNISYGKSWMKGKYPRYEAHFENKGIIVEIEIYAETSPSFVLEKEGGKLPMGFGYYRYLFIPKCKAYGWMYIEGKYVEFEGTAYYEHVWGNWSYNRPLRGNPINYLEIIDWWWENKNISKGSITLSTNNPFGYDWAWISFDNGWTLFYGAIPFWFEEIKFAIAYLYNGEKIIELGKINYEYLEGVFCEGAYIPIKIKIYAENLEITIEMDNVPHIYKDDLNSAYWKKLILYECPGKVYGIYENKINLTGNCEIEIERQISIFEYNMLKFNFYDGVEIIFVSYFLNLMIKLQAIFHPFSINFSISKIR